MRRSSLSIITALVSLVGALIWLSLGSTVPGLLWVIISIGWLVTGVIQRMKADSLEPSPGARLFRRFSRLMFWSS